MPNTMGDDSRRVRAQIAMATRRGDADRLSTLRVEFRTCRAEDYLRRVLAEAPPLTDEQRQRLASLLTAGADARVAS